MKWVNFALINGEELGISSTNIDEALKSQKPDARRFTGAEGGLGKALGLDADWAVRAVKATGNYAEIYERNLGTGSKLGYPARPQPALEHGRRPLRPAAAIERNRCGHRDIPALAGHSASPEFPAFSAPAHSRLVAATLAAALLGLVDVSAQAAGRPPQFLRSCTIEPPDQVPLFKAPASSKPAAASASDKKGGKPTTMMMMMTMTMTTRPREVSSRRAPAPASPYPAR